MSTDVQYAATHCASPLSGPPAQRHSNNSATPVDTAPPLQPTNLPLVRADSGLVCEACNSHIDTTGQCRCSH